MGFQENWVMSQLKKGVSLTPLSAMRGCGTTRLGAIIHRFRKAGYKIETAYITPKNNRKTHFASYTLKGKNK